MLSLNAKLEVICQKHGYSRDKTCGPCIRVQRLEAEYSALLEQRRN